MAPTQTSTQLAVSSEALELSVPVQTLSAVSNGRESEPSAWLAAHAAGRRWSESWMREIRTSSSMRGHWKRATARRLCPTLPQPLAIELHARRESESASRSHLGRKTCRQQTPSCGVALECDDPTSCP